MSIRLYVGNLPEELGQQELESVFASDGGDSVLTKVITDRKTGRCRGFGFVTVQTTEQADLLIEKFNGYVLGENSLRIEKALPRTKGGKVTQEEGGEEALSPDSPPPEPTAAPRRRQDKKPKPALSRPAKDPESIQPDPRWAGELERLKQILANQAANP